MEFKVILKGKDGKKGRNRAWWKEEEGKGQKKRGKKDHFNGGSGLLRRLG